MSIAQAFSANRQRFTITLFGFSPVALLAEQLAETNQRISDAWMLSAENLLFHLERLANRLLALGNLVLIQKHFAEMLEDRCQVGINIARKFPLHSQSVTEH